MNDNANSLPRDLLHALCSLLRYVEFAAIVLGVVGILTSRAAAAGPISTLYFTSGSGAGRLGLTAIEGPNVIWPGFTIFSGSHSALAVNGSVRTLGLSSPYVGNEYFLNLFPTGQSSYPFPAALGSDSVYDGTTDGTFNYAWNLTRGAAYKFNLDWTGATLLFTLGNASGNRLGITYDASNNSLWLSGYDGAVGTLISNYSLNGALLSSFNIDHDQNGFLALDPADGTLWLSRIDRDGPGLVLGQYARSVAGSFGATQTLLQGQVYRGQAVDAFGGEFQYTDSVVPEPSSLALLAFGSLALFSFRRYPRRPGD